MVITEELREKIDQAPHGLGVMVEFSFPEGTPTSEVSVVGRRALTHLFDWRQSRNPYRLGYQRDGFESSYAYSGVIKSVKDQEPIEDLSPKGREDRELVAAHVIQIWPDLKAKLV